MVSQPDSPLLAVLLVTSSSRGSHVVFRWPDKPHLRPRHSRVKYYSRAGARRTVDGGEYVRSVLDDDEEGDSGREEESSSDDSDESSLTPDSVDEMERGRLTGEEVVADSAAFGAGLEARKAGSTARRSISTAQSSPIRGSQAKSRHTSSYYGGGGGTASGDAHSLSMEQDLRNTGLMDLSEYDTFLGYDTGFLASILSPRRTLCHHRFELVVDDLAFVGHPVCAMPDGDWSWGEADEKGENWEKEDDDEQRGSEEEGHAAQMGRDGSKERTSMLGRPKDGSLRRVSSSGSGRWSEAGQERPSSSTSPARQGAGKGDKSEAEGKTAAPDQCAASSISTGSHSSISLFHFVLVLDRPDPSYKAPTFDLTRWLQVFYDNVAYKMTSALFVEQGRANYVGKEAELLLALREECIDAGKPYSDFVSLALEKSSLANSIAHIHRSISATSSAYIHVNDRISTHLQLPPSLLARYSSRPDDASGVMELDAGPEDLETEPDPLDPMSGGRPDAYEDYAAGANLPYGTGSLLLPWKTLLVLNEARVSAEGVDVDERGDGLGVGRGTEVRRDAESWVRRLVSLLQPTLSGVPNLNELAELLGYDLVQDLYPIARHLIYHREVRVIDVPRLRNIYTVSPASDLRQLPELSAAFSAAFPTLPHLPTLLAMLSAQPVPYSSLIPSRYHRAEYLHALVWLLRRDLIVQLQYRIRVVVRPEIKRKAREMRENERRQKRQRKAMRHRRMSEKVKTKADGANEDADGGDIEQQRQQRRGRRRRESSSNEITSGPPMKVVQGFGIGGETVPEELTFERRRVERSRSPSRSRTNSGVGNGARTTGSALDSPALRTTRLAGSPVPTGTSPLAVSRGSSGRGTNQSRSPSRARRKVRGFGKGEEVEEAEIVEQLAVGSASVEGKEQQEGFLSARSRHGSTTSASSTKPLAEGLRRLSLDGEESVGHDGVRGQRRSSTADELDRVEERAPSDVFDSDDEEDDEEEEEEEEEVESEPGSQDDTATIIIEPGRATKEENEWLSAMIEGKDLELVQIFLKCLTYFNGKHSTDEIVFREELRRRDMRQVLEEFSQDLITFLHP